MALSDKQLSKWITNKEFARTLVRLPDATYKQRAMLADLLRGLQDPNSLALLKALLKDDVAVVARTAGDALRQLSQDPELLAEVDRRMEKLDRIEKNKAAKAQAFYVKPTEEEELEAMRRIAFDPARGARKEELRDEGINRRTWLIGTSILLGILLLWRLLTFMF